VTTATPGLPRVALRPDQRKLVITWPDGETSAYHYVWLRHSARCSDGMPNDTSVKIDLLPDDPATLAIAEATIEGDALLVGWQDDALLTRHNLDVLRKSAYEDNARRRRKHRPVLWARDSAAAIPEFSYSQIDSDEGRLDLLMAVRDYGVAKLHEVPAQPGSIASVAEVFGPVHVNNYGRVFDVKSDGRRNLGSNTGAYLPPHTDESYRHDAPGISFFHCLQASAAGGETTLVDGFEAAHRLRLLDPESFDTLVRVPVFFQRYALSQDESSAQDDMRSHTRILVADVDGEVVGIRWTDRTLPPQDLPEEYVEPVYRAIRCLWKIINAEEMQYRYRMNPGDLHVFDNHRVLHGRLAFDPQAGVRHLQQCSVNRDEFHNSLRTLAAKLGHPAADLVMAGGAVG
jgi:gamma-butyrobetaine dioxygenase